MISISKNANELLYKFKRNVIYKPTKPDPVPCRFSDKFLLYLVQQLKVFNVYLYIESCHEDCIYSKKHCVGNKV